MDGVRVWVFVLGWGLLCVIVVGVCVFGCDCGVGGMLESSYLLCIITLGLWKEQTRYDICH